MTRFLLLRHGESEWNAAGRWQGWADPPLSPTGEAQSAEAAKRLGGFDGPVISSDLRRGLRTAEIISAALGLGPVTREEGLREADVGDWTGLTRAEIEERFPEVAEAWREGRIVQPAGGERREDFLDRILGTLKRLSLLHPGREVLAVTHGGIIHTLERHLGAWDGAGVGNLGARWFEMSSKLRVAGERLDLLAAR